MDWETLLEQHGAKLLLFARTWVNSHADAEDAVQVAIVRLWKNKKPEEEIPVGRVFIAVKHAAIDSIRSQKRRKLRETSVGNEQIDQVYMFEPSETDSERKIELEKAVKCLRPKLREVVVMKIWGEMTFKEISKALKISPNTVASRYRYGLVTLKKELDKNEK